MSTQKVFGLDYLWSPEENFLIESRNVCVWIIIFSWNIYKACMDFRYVLKVLDFQPSRFFYFGELKFSKIRAKKKNKKKIRIQTGKKNSFLVVSIDFILYHLASKFGLWCFDSKFGHRHIMAELWAKTWAIFGNSRVCVYATLNFGNYVTENLFFTILYL